MRNSGHSTWPVILYIYNLPPWLCMKRKFIIRVNLFRAIINFKVLSSTIKLHIFGTVPLLIWSTLTHAILYIWNSLGPTCRPEYFRMSLSAPARRPNPTRAHPTGAAVPIPPSLSLPLPRTLDPQIRRTRADGSGDGWFVDLRCAMKPRHPAEMDDGNGRYGSYTHVSGSICLRMRLA